MRPGAVLVLLLAAAASDVGAVVSAFTARTAAAAHFAAAAQFAPRPVVAPAVTGAAREGETLTASAGTWERDPHTIATAWLRCDAAGDACTAIDGATGAAYTLVEADAGRRIRAAVTATNDAGSTRSVSSPTGVVERVAPVSLTAPAIAGTARWGERLTADTGEWLYRPDAYAWRWSRCDAAGVCAEIDGATGAAYDVVLDDVGFTLQVRVTATNAAGGTDARSAATAPVDGRPPENTALPVVSGEARVGEPLTATLGDWRYGPFTTAIDWRACDADWERCELIAGSEGRLTFTPTATQAGRHLHVVVVATNAFGATQAISPLTAAVEQEAK